MLFLQKIVSLPPIMRIRIKSNNFIKWALVVLFASYVGGITLFTHTHIIDKVTYVHSHPFHKGEHSHSDGQLMLLHQFFHTSISSSVIPEFDFSDKSDVRAITYPRFHGSEHFLKSVNNPPLRAPPAAA